MKNKILKPTNNKTCNPLLIALVRQLQKMTNLRLSAALLVCLEFTACFVVLVTFLLYTNLNTVCSEHNASFHKNNALNNCRGNSKMLPKICMLHVEERSNKGMVLKKASFSHLPGNIQLPWPTKKFPTREWEIKRLDLSMEDIETGYKRTNYKQCGALLPKGISSRCKATLYA